MTVLVNTYSIAAGAETLLLPYRKSNLSSTCCEDNRENNPCNREYHIKRLTFANESLVNSNIVKYCRISKIVNFGNKYCLALVESKL